MRCVPRPKPKVLKGKARIKTPWDFFKSVFKQYKPDTTKIIEQCFDFDWELTKCQKILRTEEEAADVRQYLKSNYKMIRETYKYYAGIDPVGRIPCVGPNGFYELMHSSESFIDGKAIKQSDIDLQIVATNSGRFQMQFNPDR